MNDILVVAGGGSGGHTSAASSVIQFLQQRQDITTHVKIVWITSRNGIETQVARELGVDNLSIATGKLHRGLNRRTIPDLVRALIGIIQSWILIGKIKPALVFSTGGYVAVPIVIAGAFRRVPIIVHEQTLAVGLANRVSAIFAKKIALSYEESREFFPKEKCIVTGCPVRPEIFRGSVKQAAELFGLSAVTPTIYVTGGAQGASSINRCIGEILPQLLAHFQVIHQCGTIATDFGIVWLSQIRAELPEELQRRYKVLEYIHTEEIGSVFKIADLIVSRSGAGITAEITALNKPCILIPYPFSMKNEQRLHASMLERRGLAQVIIDKELTPNKLLESILKAFASKNSNEVPKQRGQAASGITPVELISLEIMKMMQDPRNDGKKKSISQEIEGEKGVCPACKEKALITIIDDADDGIVWAQCNNCGYMYRCG